MKLQRFLPSVLISLIFLDLILTVWGFFFPELWYRFFHGADYIDPQALLKRCAGNWLAFFILQTIAFFRYRKASWWLILVAGCRLGDSFTDITCLIFSSSITIYGVAAFLIAGGGNILLGGYLIKMYLQLNPARREQTGSL